MSDPVATKNPEKQMMLPLHMSLRGRVDAHRFVDKRYFTTLTTPAADEFSKPQQFEVRSDYKLGEMGEIVHGTVLVSGYVSRKPYIDKKSGENKIFIENNVYFDWVK